MLVWGATNDTNPGIRLHLDNGDDFDDWTESASGTSSVNAETSDVQAGSVSCRLDVDAIASNVFILHGGMTIGHTYDLTYYAKGTGGGVGFNGGTFSPSSQDVTSSWEQCNHTYLASSETIVIGRKSGASAGKSIYLDSVSVVRTGPHVGSTAGPEETNYLTPGDGDTIVSWTCRATDVDFIQATAASRPVYVAPGSAIGAKYGALDFDGTDDYLSRTVAGWMSTSTSGAIFLVMEVNDTAAMTPATRDTH
jgi:hypothetical protein